MTLVKCMGWIIDIDNTKATNEEWKRITEEQLRTAAHFEIHCWSDETDSIALALKYGTVKPDNWAHGTVIAGDVTPEFTDMLLSIPKPDKGSDGYNKMTPFFTIHLDNGYWSEHYGTELNHE